MAIFFILAFCLITALGALCGAFRRFTKTSLGGVIVLLSLALVRIIGGTVKIDGNVYGIMMLCVSVGSVLLFTLVFNVLKKLLKKAVEERRILSHYQNKDDIEEIEAYIMDAVDKKDKKAYKTYRKKLKKIKDKAGVWGILDIVFGGVEGALNAAVIIGSIIMGLLMFVDVSGIGGLTEICAKSLSSGAWVNFGSCIVIDIILLGVLFISIQTGYKSGLSNALCIFVVLGLTALFAVGAWAIASNSPNFVSKIQSSLSSGGLSSVMGGNMGELIAKIIVAAIIFLLSLIIIILIAIFLPKLVEKLRKNKVFKTVDGVIGAFVACLLIFGAMLVIGAIAYNLFNGYDVVRSYSFYAKKAFFGSGLYDLNPLKGLFGNISK